MRRLVRFVFGFIAAALLATSALYPPQAMALPAPVNVQVVIRLRLPVSELNKIPASQRGTVILCDGQMAASYVRDGFINSTQRIRDSITGSRARTLECLIRFSGVRYQRRVNITYSIPNWGWDIFSRVDDDGDPISLARFTGVSPLRIVVPGSTLRARTFNYVINLTIVNGKLVAAN